MRILCFDQGAHLGWAIIELDEESKGFFIVDSGCEYYDSKLPMSQRQNLYTLFISTLIRDAEADYIVAEAINRIKGSTLNKRNESTWLLSWIFGEIIRLSEGMELFSVNPISMKACITGNGRADKGEVKKSVIEILRKQDPKFVGNKMRSDEADSIGLGITWWRIRLGEYVPASKVVKKKRVGKDGK